jgi:Flp pilus assembly protein TadD
MKKASSSAWQPFAHYRFPIFALLALGVLGGISPRGAELVPFRGVEPDDFNQRPVLPEEASSGGTAADLALTTDFQNGVLAMGRGDLVAARKTFKSVLARQPQHLGSLINLGWMAQREKVWTEAEAFLKRAQILAPDNPSVWLALGVVYLEQDRVDFALAAFSQVVALDPANARAHRMLGLTLGRKEWYAAAEGELRRSLEIEPRDAGAHFNLAVVYLQRQPVALELARRHYNISIDLGSAPDPKIDAMLAQSESVSGGKPAALSAQEPR